VDVIILAPPWGGINYSAQAKFDLDKMITCGSGLELLALAAGVCNNVVYLLPRNTNKKQLRQLATILDIPCRIENVYIHDKCKMMVVYFGTLFN
jgi:hypothetical protein